MLQKFFPNPDVVDRLRQGPLSGHLDEFATRLSNRGYSARTIRDYVRAASHFSVWLEAVGVSVSKVDERVVEQFLADHRCQCTCAVLRPGRVQYHRHGLKAVLFALRDAGVLKPQPAVLRPHWAQLVDEYGLYLTQVRGVVSGTQRVYMGRAAALLAAKFGNARAEPSQLRVADFAAAVVERGRACSAKEAQLTASALRSFARYLHVVGLVGPELARGVPSPSLRKASKLPEVLDDDQVASFLMGFNRECAMGQRGFAMAMLLVTLGLRACEVSNLALEDIDWRRATVRITRGKGRQTSVLPLPRTVGEALADYVTNGRPETSVRQVFVRHVFPVGTPLTPCAVRAAIRRGFQLAGIEAPSTGTHVLRRTAATRMMRAGASVKEVADVLRHRSIDTTVLYARTDLHNLSAVAMPWPGATP